MSWTESFVARLARAETGIALFNQYADGTPASELRRANLLRYLQLMEARRPSTLLVLEAPGYRGCRLTGLPMTSRRVMLAGLPGLALFGPGRGWRDVNEAGFEDVQGEQSATILWSALADMEVLPLLWNACPWHPQRLGESRSNRRPRSAEIAMGRPFLQALGARFAPARTLAIGRVAQGALRALKIEAPLLRHPAHGGKRDFVDGLHEWLV